MKITLPIVNNQTNHLEIDLNLSSLDIEGDCGLWVFVGTNNSKKSVLLKNIQKKTSGQYVSPQRFEIKSSENVPSDLDTAIKNQRQMSEKWFYDSNMMDISEYPNSSTYLELLNMLDDDINELFKFHNRHFDELKLEHSRLGASRSPLCISIAGQPASTAGTGSRSLLYLLVRIFDSSSKVVCIDEPEMGLEPRKQKALAKLFKEKSQSKKIFLATHSNLFLDRKVIERNFRVSSDANNVYLDAIQDETDLVRASFDLLGGSPTDIFFPSNILVVEGRSDKIFLEKLVELLYPGSSLAVHFAEGITKIDYAIPAIEQMLKSLSYLDMYKNKLCVLIDHGGINDSMITEWRSYLGDNDEKRVIQLPKNGIEFYYPKNILKKVLNTETEISDESIRDYLTQCSASGRDDKGELAGTKISKVELAKKVSRLITSEDLAGLEARLQSIVTTLEELAFPE